MLRSTWLEFKSILDDHDKSHSMVETDSRYLLSKCVSDVEIMHSLDKTPTITTWLDDYEENYLNYANIFMNEVFSLLAYDVLTTDETIDETKQYLIAQSFTLDSDLTIDGTLGVL